MKKTKAYYFLRAVKYHCLKGTVYLSHKKSETKRLVVGALGSRGQSITTIQLPITYMCNFDCVMCGMHHMINRKDFSHEELRSIIKDPLFSNVKSVGINGGEPFVKSDLLECIDVIIDTLPNLKEFYFISNGYLTDRILSSLSEIMKRCRRNNIVLNLSISVDGIGKIQDFHRGHKKAFENADNTIVRILENKKSYVDYLNVICTITRYNIGRINEVEMWAKKRGIDVAYNIATVNHRIENEDRVDDFSVLRDKRTRMLCAEFFYNKAFEDDSEKYYAIYLFLRYGKRFSSCPCIRKQMVTLTPNGELSYCATHSKELGSALKDSAIKIYNKNLGYLTELKETCCDTCSHYIYSLNAVGLKLWNEEKRRIRFVR